MPSEETQENLVADGQYGHEYCVKCGYNLTGLGREGRCPECGLSIATGVETRKYPYAHLRLRHQLLFVVTTACLPVFWFMLNCLGRLILPVRSVAILQLMNLIAVPLLLLMCFLVVALLVRCIRFGLMPRDIYYRPINEFAYAGLFLISLIAVFAFLVGALG
ncbi:MAG: hypothetical protein GXP29_00220 [Planctomycetes bacterium]|nr:hypothetical protein [Planctomycetota bacterium]